MFIWDLDGTLSDDSHRSHLLHGVTRESHPERWREHYDLCHLDPPIVPIARILNKLRWSTHCEIWTGRCDSVKEKTERWLLQHVFRGDGNWCVPGRPGHVPLKMRRVTEHLTPNVELKRRWVKEVGGPKAIEMVFEDAAHMTKFWRGLGIRCAAVDHREYNA